MKTIICFLLFFSSSFLKGQKIKSPFQVDMVSLVGDKQINPFLNQEHQNMVLFGGWQGSYNLDRILPRQGNIEMTAYSPRFRFREFDESFTREQYAFRLQMQIDSVFVVPVFIGDISFGVSVSHFYVQNGMSDFFLQNGELYIYTSLVVGLRRVSSMQSRYDFQYQYYGFILPFNDEGEVSSFFNKWLVMYRFEFLRGRFPNESKESLNFGYRQSLTYEHHFTQQFTIHLQGDLVIITGGDPFSFAQYESNRDQIVAQFSYHF